LRESIVKIIYIDHSGFIVEDSSWTLVIDCCGLTQESAAVRERADKHLYILASHVHGDHFNPNIMSFGGAHRQWILSADIRGKVPQGKDIVFIAKGEQYRDERVAVKAYGSTDEGISFYIEAGGKKIFHAGDLNNWHWNEEETPEDAAKNEQWFLEELAQIARELPELDAAMFPVDPRLGKDYTRGAEQFLGSIKTGLFMPMHFWDNIEAARAFKQAAEQKGCRFADIRAAGDTFEL
jgi:L-ascorbate metabolism protein UlaG (beta-lactamase superfamily)